MECLCEVQKQLLEVIQRSRVIDHQIRTMRETTLLHPMTTSDISVDSGAPLMGVTLNNESLDHDESTLLADTIYSQHCASASDPVSINLPSSVESQQAGTIDFLVSVVQSMVRDANAVLHYAEQVSRVNELRDAIQPRAYVDPIPDYFSLVEQVGQSKFGAHGPYNPIGRFIRYVYSLIDRNAALQRELQKHTSLYTTSC